MDWDSQLPVQRNANSTTTRTRSYESHTYTMAPRAEIMVAWQDYVKTAQTGDIVLFSGKSLISTAIKFLGELGSNWSHIGMIVVLKDGRVMIWESTNADGQVDQLSHTRKGGVRLVEAETALRAYLASGDGAMVVIRRLYVDQQAIDSGLVDPAKHIPRLQRFMKAVANLPYERDPIELLRASESARWLQLIYAWRGNSSYFCSELVASSYIQLGLLPADNEPTASTGAAVPSARDASLYTPMDFAQESQDLPFLYDKRTNKDMVALGPHLQIVFPDAGTDPMPTAPRRMLHPTRPEMRIDMQSLQAVAAAASSKFGFGHYYKY